MVTSRAEEWFLNNQLPYKMESRIKYLRGEYSNTKCFSGAVLGLQARKAQQQMHENDLRDLSSFIYIVHIQWDGNVHKDKIILCNQSLAARLRGPAAALLSPLWEQQSLRPSSPAEESCSPARPDTAMAARDSEPAVSSPRVLQLRDVCAPQRRCIFERCLPNRRSSPGYERHNSFSVSRTHISKSLVIQGCQVAPLL